MIQLLKSFGTVMFPNNLPKTWTPKWDHLKSKPVAVLVMVCLPDGNVFSSLEGRENIEALTIFESHLTTLLNKVKEQQTIEEWSFCSLALVEENEMLQYAGSQQGEVPACPEGLGLCDISTILEEGLDFVRNQIIKKIFKLSIRTFCSRVQ